MLPCFQHKKMQASWSSYQGQARHHPLWVPVGILLMAVPGVGAAPKAFPSLEPLGQTLLELWSSRNSHSWKAQ